jgi:hypothetical protein
MLPFASENLPGLVDLKATLDELQRRGGLDPDAPPPDD